MEFEDNSNGVTSLNGLYQEYFLDYASYVILERAVPAVKDGCKPVHRRILHAMRMMDDGRFHKVANIIGQTMQYHPHGDAAIGDALVGLGQKDLMIDTQGNWGDIRTGDSAAASRYIEARLTKFALDVAFNKQTTVWQLSYDGRKNEPIHLPLKFPLLLAQGVEGIAVGLSTKIMPHNFLEILDASVAYLKGKSFKLYPDFQTGGKLDVSEYNDGKRGGKIKCRAKIEIQDKNTLLITELPYGVTTNSMIESILKANDKGKIKVKKVTDNTAKDVEIQIDLQSGVSPEMTMDALYAFTRCEESISPNACVIINNKPRFLTISEILQICTDNTKDLLRQELAIKKAELLEKWHFSSLEKIFIEKRIYRDIEECESWEEVLVAIRKGLEKYVATPKTKKGEGDKRFLLQREITEEDIAKLTEIKIKRISKYNSFKADELIQEIEDQLKHVQHDLDNLVDYTIQWFEYLKDKYGAGKERITELTEFEEISARRVVANNAKLYVDKKEGFFGTGMKKAEFVCDCSDLDDIIVFRKDGHFGVYRIADKIFAGKDIIHIAVWKKNDERTTYNMLYVDGKTGVTRAKRFNVSSITRNKDYDLTKGTDGSRTLYFTDNPNGETELLSIQLSQGCKAKKKLLEYDFADIDIKGRRSQGNIVTKYPIRKVIQEEQGTSSLGAQKFWMDDVSGRLNREERGMYLGKFDVGDHLIVFTKNGEYFVRDLNIDIKVIIQDLLFCAKLSEESVFNAVYYDGEKDKTMVKRFEIETSTMDTPFSFITDHKKSKIYYVSDRNPDPIKYTFKDGRKHESEELDLTEFIDVKGWKALGNRLHDGKLIKIESIEIEEDENEEPKTSDTSDTSNETSDIVQTSLFDDEESSGYSAGDTIEFDD